MERRIAHMNDRIAGFFRRLRDRSTMRRTYEPGDEFDIPV